LSGVLRLVAGEGGIGVVPGHLRQLSGLLEG